MKPIHTLARNVQAGQFRDREGKWEIVRVEVTRDGSYVYIARKTQTSLTVNSRRNNGRWRMPAIPGDTRVTVYELD